MKRLLFILVLFAVLAAAFAKAEARTDVSIDFFYNNLGDDGSWAEIGGYGYVWQPTVAATNRSWRPYADGYWAYTDVGWTWVSYEDFGWATYHYGRWTRVQDRGWFWIPGREWGPAWVSWRTGGDYVGWAPLPPRGGGEVVYEGRPVSGAVDLDYDIGPEYYNFVDIRYFGEPVLRDRICDVGQNFGYVSNTVNVTNISYGDAQVCNFGPDYNTLSAYSTRPIQRLTLQRDLSADLHAAAQSGALTRVKGDKLLVTAPPLLQKPATPLAPKVVKERIAQPAIDRGWAKNQDAKAQQELKEKIRAQDPKNIPPTTIAPRSNSAATAERTLPGAGPESAGMPAAAPENSPVEQSIQPTADAGKRDGKHPDAQSSPHSVGPEVAKPAREKVAKPNRERAIQDRSRNEIAQPTRERRDRGAAEKLGKHQAASVRGTPHGRGGGERLERSRSERPARSEGGGREKGPGGKKGKDEKAPPRH